MASVSDVLRAKSQCEKCGHRSALERVEAKAN